MQPIRRSYIDRAVLRNKAETINSRLHLRSAELGLRPNAIHKFNQSNSVCAVAREDEAITRMCVIVLCVPLCCCAAAVSLCYSVRKSEPPNILPNIENERACPPAISDNCTRAYGHTHAAQDVRDNGGIASCWLGIRAGVWWPK